MNKAKVEIRRRWLDLAAEYHDLTLTTIGLKLGTDAAHEIGRFNVNSKSAGPRKSPRKYLQIWQQVGNTWKLGTDTPNSDAE